MSLKEKYIKLYSGSLNEYIILNELCKDINVDDLQEFKELLKDPDIGSNLRRDLVKIQKNNRAGTIIHGDVSKNKIDAYIEDAIKSYEAFEYIIGSYINNLDVFKETLESLITNTQTNNTTTVKFLKYFSLKFYGGEDTLLENICVKYRKESGRKEMMDFVSRKLVDHIYYEPVNVDLKTIWLEYLSKEAIREYKLKQL